MKRKNQTIFKTEKKHRQSLNYTPIYMTNEGPKWFTEPMYSIENPFGI